MNKYGYRIIFAIYIAILFAYIVAPSNPSQVRETIAFIALFPLLPILFIVEFFVEFGTDNIITKQLAYLFCYSALFILAAFFFLRKWLLVEFQDAQDVQYKKAKNLLLLVSAFLIPLHFITSIQGIFVDPKVMEYQKKLDLVPIDIKTIRIENYQETPFTMWGSQSPLGLIIEFDLVGGNQENLLASFYYKTSANSLPNKQNSSAYSERYYCIADNPQAEKLESAFVNREDYLKRQNFLLSDTTKNHLKFICHNPKLHNFIRFSSQEEICPYMGVLRIVEENPSSIKISAEIEVRDIESKGQTKELGDIFKRDANNNPLILSGDFWLDAINNFTEILPNAGYHDCSESASSKNKSKCYCKNAL